MIPLHRFLACVAVLGCALLSGHWLGADTPAITDIIPPGAKLQKLWGEGAFTEGGTMLADGSLVFSDIPGDRLMHYDPATGKVSVWRQPSGKANGTILTPDGRFAAAEGADAGARRVSITESDGTVRTLADRYQGKRLNSPNDIAADSVGRIYFTDPRYVGQEERELDHESVYRIDLDGTLTRIISQCTKPNGITVSPDQKNLYLSEHNGSPGGRRQLWKFDLRPDGTVANRRVVWDFGTGRGIDGMTHDSLGNLYATAAQGAEAGVYVFSPKDQKIGFIPTPEPPANCEFAGPDRRHLYIAAGESLYRIHLAVPGHHLYPPPTK